VFEVFLRLHPEQKNYDAHNRLSEKFPGARISLWCNSNTDILEIEADGLESFEGLQKELDSASKAYRSKILSKTYCQDKFQLVARTCVCGESCTAPTGPVIEQHNFLEIPPLVLMAGWEYHRLVGFDDADLKGLLNSLDKVGETEVLHKKSLSEGVTDDTFLLSLNSLFGQLTEKQSRALLSAVDSGYYEIPKRTTSDELAKNHGQPRSTFEEHIRKAESKVVLAMAPYLMMYARVPGSPFNSRTKAAGATVGARVMKQLVVQAATKNRKPN
jgi:predicted DNA binding protein